MLSTETATSRPGSKERPWSVAQLMRLATTALEDHVGQVWVEGEVDSLLKAASGHIYFSLKDPNACIRAVMWRTDALKLKFALQNGQTLRCAGRLGIYERDGKFQMYVLRAEPAGLGAEALALEQLRAKLAEEGLFATERKRPLPAIPRRLGIVTSQTGAAVQDIIKAAHRRFPVDIVIADCRVQGDSAPASIVRALQLMARARVDVVIVGRGGGASNDLAAFQNEAVVRAVATFPVPIISAVGHEIDVSLTDLVADMRAATPTMAAEMAVPVLADLLIELTQKEKRFTRELERHLRAAAQGLDLANERIYTRVLQLKQSRLRQLLASSGKLAGLHPQAHLMAQQKQLNLLSERLARISLPARLAKDKRACDELAVAAQRDIMTLLRKKRSDLVGASSALSALSPLRVLERGYSLVKSENVVIREAKQVTPGDEIYVQLHQGELQCRVEKIRE